MGTPYYIRNFDGTLSIRADVCDNNWSIFWAINKAEAWLKAVWKPEQLVRFEIIRMPDVWLLHAVVKDKL